MSLFISDAWAQQAPPPQGSPLSMFIMFGLLFVVFYFFLIRPQQKRQKEHRELISRLAKGDEVVTSGGLVGRVREVGENFVVLELAKGVEVKVQKGHVQTVLPKGATKSL